MLGYSPPYPEGENFPERTASYQLIWSEMVVPVVTFDTLENLFYEDLPLHLL